MAAGTAVRAAAAMAVLVALAWLVAAVRRRAHERAPWHEVELLLGQ